LERDYPHLVPLVDNGTLTLAGALAAGRKERDEQIAHEKRTVTEFATRFMGMLPFAAPTPRKELIEFWGREAIKPTVTTKAQSGGRLMRSVARHGLGLIPVTDPMWVSFAVKIAPEAWRVFGFMTPEDHTAWAQMSRDRAKRVADAADEADALADYYARGIHRSGRLTTRAAAAAGGYADPWQYGDPDPQPTA